jgi:hypothetical protein
MSRWIKAPWQRIEWITCLRQARQALQCDLRGKLSSD